jgi:hypothetical protein
MLYTTLTLAYLTLKHVAKRLLIYFINYSYVERGKVLFIC